MKAKGIFISTLLVIDTFFVSYYFGVHSRKFKVVDPDMPKQTLPAVAPAANKTDGSADKTKTGKKNSKDAGNSNDKVDKKGGAKAGSGSKAKAKPKANAKANAKPKVNAKAKPKGNAKPKAKQD